MKNKTRVIKYGAFWKVQVCQSGNWFNTRDLYLTRQDARNGRFFWSYQ